ncbi:replication initiation protein [Vagococcus fluvialis]|uniref:replication initiation protein n=1 Tax=Vagococcus fluvialis TaxID=2738 RepID=UPI00288F950A|nr:replication initiation protein [Vagococcus fluvialis]MDT2783022.1 replication initiation protein [Vagococcus fluvialis]
MANEVVKYQNDLNTATMRTWTEKEMNILFSIVAKIRDTSNYETMFTFSQLKELAKFKKNLTKKEFVEDLISVSKKLGSLNYLERSEDGMNAKLFILFQTFDISGDNETLKVMVHPQFEYVFNKIGMEFTQFELDEFIRIQSTYAKSTYRLLKQYRTTGWWKVTIEDFKLLLDIPKSYRPSDIDRQILKPILEQLGGSDEDAIFRNLKITKNKKAGRGRGGILTGYTFTFEKEKTGEWIDEKYKKKSQRKETLPDWANENVTETKLSAEEEAEFRKRIEDLNQKNNN